VNFHETRIRVRFNETDPYQVAWHGHYVAWMDEARNELAGRFGVDAAQIAAAGFRAPVVALEVKYLRPAHFGEELVLRTTLVPRQSATLEFACQIFGANGALLARGRTVHALTDAEGVLQYTLPQPVARGLAALENFLGV
jgi:acyl-CoA thioester hydrolase